MIVEDAGTTEKNPTSRMGTGPVLNVEITTSLGEKIAIDAMHLKAMLEATVVHVVITVVVTEEVVDSAEMSKAVNARAIVNNDRVMTDRRAENTKAAMIANPSDGTHEAPVGGARKARVEIVGAEISRGVFI